MTKSIILLAVFIATLISCNGCGDKKEITEAEVQKAQEQLIAGNKKQHEREMKDIAQFIRKKKWTMQETKTGLHYWIYENGTGPALKQEDIASVSYTITLLDETKCYETTDANPKVIRVGHDNVETGLHEALLLMHVGDKAKLILPSHLAFGFTGDSGKIPQNASVVYDLHVIGVQ